MRCTRYLDYKFKIQKLSEKKANITTIVSFLSKCDFFDGSKWYGIRSSKIFSFVLDELFQFKVFCELETKRQQEISETF